VSPYDIPSPHHRPRRPRARLLVTLGLAAPASAATLGEKLSVLSSFTQATTGSQGAWSFARSHQGQYAQYTLDWSTDFCSASPDQPLGFDFRMPCARHDFGYRNYKAMNAFPANKPRIDDAFYADLLAKCSTYNVFVRPACNSLAWTYFQAVKTFGNLAVSQADLGRAAKLKAEGLSAQAAASPAERAPV